MIISASRRTDIPSYYSEWLFNRLEEGYVYVRNPMNFHQISKINLSPDVVDAIVFWTKNPVPMLDQLNRLTNYNFYFQFTVNAYGPDVEPNIPPKESIIIPAFQDLSKKIGREKVIWRYDPIFLNDKYTVEYHIKYFELFSALLADYTEKCTVSFIDFYHTTEQNVRPLCVKKKTNEQYLLLMEKFSEISKKYGFYIDTCSEAEEYNHLGIQHASCIDKARIEKIGNFKLKVEKDKNQRVTCGCVSSIDIGAYNTCKNGCLYCYANYNQKIAVRNYNHHDPRSPILFGEVEPNDKITERKMESYIDNQLEFSDL